MIPRKSASDEWLNLLRGGFNFEAAPFGVHPLDKQRAERMVYVATRAGVSEAGIVAAAERYLCDERNLHADVAGEELARVKSFLSRYQLSRKAKRAWLIFWNSSEYLVDNSTSKLVQVFDPRMSARRICEFLEFHYRAVEYTPLELLHYSTRPRKNPYRSQDNASAKPKGTSYICGHDPWLEARYCSDIMIWEIVGEGPGVSWLTDPIAST